MNPFGWITRVMVLAFTLGLTGASCAVQKSTLLIKDVAPRNQQRTEALTSRELDVSVKDKVQATFGKLPLNFEANQGQTDRQVKFLSRGRGHTLFLTPAEAVLALVTTQTHGDVQTRPIGQGRLPNPKSKIENQKWTVLRMKLMGANLQPHMAGLEELPGKVNYFIGNDPKKWRAKIPTYAEVKYRDVYPGVDLVYYGNQRQLEYDFVVASGTDPAVITLGFQGADKLEIDTQGDLILHTASGDLRMRKPLVYQEVDGVRTEISVAYVLNSTSPIPNPQSKIQNPKSQSVGFQVGAYDASSPLVIDPVLVYSTYLGGSGNDDADSITVDGSGNAYVTGITHSTDFPTMNPLQPAFGGGIPDAFVAKLDPTGSVLLYSTYLGGNSNDYGNGIAVDSFGNAYVTGQTLSTDFPTMNPLQPNLLGGSDAFVAKLNADGSALVYSTYLGGTDTDWANSIAVDASGNAYVTGVTFSTDFPTMNPLQPAFGGGFTDAFVAKLNTDGSQILYSTYLGGSGGDTARGIAVDGSGSAYVTGETSSSTDFPTMNPLQPAFGGGIRDAFVAKLDPTGSALLYSTYLGGSDTDVAEGIAVDGSGSAYVTGVTFSTDFPTANALQPAFGGGFTDAFVARINPTGSALVYSTYLGGSGDEDAHSIAVDGSGSAYVAGGTSSTDFPTMNPLQPAFGGGFTDAFVAKLNPIGSAFVYSTYLGGSGDEDADGITVDGSGNAYVVGLTTSADFPTVNPLQPALAGGSDAFVAKIAAASASAELSVFKIGSPDPVTVGDYLTYTLIVANNGPDDATGVTLTDTLPAEVTLVWSTPNQGSCAEAGGLVACDLGEVAAAASAMVEIVGIPTAEGEITNTAAVAGNEADPDITNNTATQTTTVTAPKSIPTVVGI